MWQKVIVLLLRAFGPGSVVGVDKVQQPGREVRSDSRNSFQHRFSRLIEIELCAFITQAKPQRLAFSLSQSVDGKIPAVGAIVECQMIAKSFRSILPFQ